MQTAMIAPTTPQPLLAASTHEPREIHPEALAALATVRRMQLVDLYEREHVIEFAAGLGFTRGADWLRANRHLYFVALRQSGPNQKRWEE